MYWNLDGDGKSRVFTCRTAMTGSAISRSRASASSGSVPYTALQRMMSHTWLQSPLYDRSSFRYTRDGALTGAMWNSALAAAGSEDAPSVGTSTRRRWCSNGQWKT